MTTSSSVIQISVLLGQEKVQFDVKKVFLLLIVSKGKQTGLVEVNIFRT
jgi:hypothetical protein